MGVRPVLPPVFGENEGDILGSLFGGDDLPGGERPAQGQSLAERVGQPAEKGPILPEGLQSGADDFVFGLAPSAPPETGESGNLPPSLGSFGAAPQFSASGASGFELEQPSAVAPAFEPSHIGPPAGKGPGGGGGGGGGAQETLFATYTSGESDYDAAGNFVADFFNIEIEFYGDWDVAFMDAFAAAADFLSSVMAEGLRDDPAAFHSFDTGTLFTVDDVLIEARLPAIDGSGNVLGRAGAYSVRDAGTVDEYTTVVGVMEFDSADAADLLAGGQWDDVILHEMIHTLGFGSLWDNFYPGLVTETTTQIAGQDTRRPSDDVYETTAVYNGTSGNAEYNAELGTTGEKIVVETDGGSGTALAHWDEQTYWGELMTGYLYSDFDQDGNPDPVYLADWSIAALADIGYHVDTASFAGAGVQNDLADGIDLETVDPLMAFYDTSGDVLFA